MASRNVDLWAEIIAEEEEEEHQLSARDKEPEIVYRRQISNVIPHKDLPRRQSNSSSRNRARKSIAPVKRVSWNRSLYTRGRTSIAAAAYVDQPKQRKPRRNAKPPLPRGKDVEPPNYDKELAYFQEVDAYELLEESPSPKKPNTWTMGSQVPDVVPHLSSILRNWLISKKLNRTYAFPGSLSKILETPVSSSTIKAPGEEYLGVQLNEKPLSSMPIEETSEDIGVAVSKISLTSRPSSLETRVLSSTIETSGEEYLGVQLTLSSTQQRLKSSLNEKPRMPIEETCEDIEVAISKLSLTSRPSLLDSHAWDSFSALLTACGQSVPLTLTDMLSSYCEKENITKVGEGTYGEAFKVGDKVCKIVPFDGDLPVNGEPQKKSEELLEEVVLSCTLNHLRGLEGDVSNACTSFIQTVDVRVCQGCYDSALIRAWEDWDAKNNSENDNPREFPSDQCYVIFVQEHGGRDLENFVLSNFNEVRSFLVQVTLALAVAEAAYEFEHRDLHWGNVLIARKHTAALQFVLEGKKLLVKTFGLLVSIIDFTLSRINTVAQILQRLMQQENDPSTGLDILFLDLSSDPELFEGKKGDKQADTYRKMRDVTDECWEGSFPKTNVLWLQYLVNVLILKKSYERSSKDMRELRSLNKRLNNYGSAKECVSDPFFTDLFIEES